MFKFVENKKIFIKFWNRFGWVSRMIGAIFLVNMIANILQNSLLVLVGVYPKNCEWQKLVYINEQASTNRQRFGG